MQTTLPYNLEAEEHVISACLLSDVALDIAAETLRPQDIYTARLRTIFEHCLESHRAGEPADPILLADRIKDDLARQALRELAATPVATSNVGHYARVVREQSMRRSLIDTGQTITRSGWERDDVGNALLEAEKAIFDLTTQNEPGELQHVSRSLPHTFDLLARPGGEITGTPTGLKDLDAVTAGLQPGNLVVVAARPGQGKSALALQAALHTALSGRTAAMFTLEMSAEEINQRALSSISRVPLMRIRTRVGLTPEDRSKLMRAGETYQKACLYVDDTVSARVTDIRSRSRRLKTRNPDIGLIVVDYLQLMLHDGNGKENREQQVAGISRGLKLLARELDVPVMALAQLNREVERRGADAKPMLADLRDSGAIEQDADVVVFIHRSKNDETNTAELIVAKHRNGPTDAVTVTWLPRYATFANHAGDQ